MSANVDADPGPTEWAEHQKSSSAFQFGLSTTQQQPPRMQQHKNQQAQQYLSKNDVFEPTKSFHHVSLTFDRQKITSCTCTCISAMDVGTAPALMKSPGQVSTVPDSHGARQPLPSLQPDQSTRPRRLPESTMVKWASWRLQQQYDQTLHGLHHKRPPKLSPMGIWCPHVVATCLTRIRTPESVLLRAPLSESLAKLSKVDLQKFAQNLICVAGAEKVSSHL